MGNIETGIIMLYPMFAFTWVMIYYVWSEISKLRKEIKDEEVK